MSKFMRISADADPDAELRYTSSRKNEPCSDEMKELIGVYETHSALWYASCSEYRNNELKN